MDENNTHTDRGDIEVVVRSVYSENRNIVLSALDIALLILISHYIRTKKDSAFTITDQEIRLLAGRLDVMISSEAQSAEKRYTDTISRLIKSECLSRSDMNRLIHSEDIEYQMTTIGDNVTAWHIERERFYGAPLTAKLKAFNEILLRIAIDAECEDIAIRWQVDIVGQMEHVLKDMMADIHRHQQELDRDHERLRAFIPSLLTEPSEGSIKLCENQLREVITTIDDLQEVTLSAANAALQHIAKIDSIGALLNSPETELVCRELERRLHSITLWTTQRASDWVEHHNVVHDFLRGIVNIDRNRRITGALKQALSAEPLWTLSVAEGYPFIRLREDVTEPASRKAPRRARKDYSYEVLEQIPDTVPGILSDIIATHDDAADILLSSILKEAVNRGATEPVLMGHLPWLIVSMLKSGRLDNSTKARALNKITDVLDIEEMRITHDIHDR